MKITKITITSLALISSVLLLAAVVKGALNADGSLRYQSDRGTQVGSPYEATNSTSRYALVEAMVKDKTFFLTNELARFATPDLVRIGDKYMSIFTPGVPFLAVPFYWVGDQIGMPQLVTYLSTLVIAIINAFLVTRLARRLGASSAAASVAGFLFLFGTNALPYALTLTQHHASILFLLLAALNVCGPRTLVKNIILGALFGFGLLIDIPNALMMLPFVLYALAKHVEVVNGEDLLRMKIKLSFVVMVVGLLPFVAVFAWYNHETTGSYTSVGQTIGRYDYPGDGVVVPPPVISQERAKALSIPYRTRNQLLGFYTLLLSDERGWAYYSPVILFGIVGLIFTYKERKLRGITAMLVSSIGVTIVSYAMFGDPWGGWSFGPRYLLPATALVCAGIAVAIDKYKTKIVFGLLLTIASIYSIAINVLGAFTTNSIPPKIEAIHLLSPIPYTYTYNVNLLFESGMTSSLSYNALFSNFFPASTYYIVLTVIAIIVFMSLYFISIGKTENAST